VDYAVIDTQRQFCHIKIYASPILGTVIDPQASATLIERHLIYTIIHPFRKISLNFSGAFTIQIIYSNKLLPAFWYIRCLYSISINHCYCYTVL